MGWPVDRAGEAIAGGGRLTGLTAGMAVLYGGDRLAYVTKAQAQAFQPGDHLLVVQETGDLLHVPRAVRDQVSQAVGQAEAAFAGLAQVSDQAISDFFEGFAARLGDEATWAVISAANQADVAVAAAKGRSTTRLVADAPMRRDMIAGLLAWRDASARRDQVMETHRHQGWSLEQVRAPLGVTGFVFEGRPNVFADATGVLRTGNSVVFRIGSDALGTARAIVAEALAPALEAAGLPAGSAVLVDSPERAAGWALFSDARLSLAVARGSGAAVAQLGAIARQAGTPVSLHSTGGAWLVADTTADPGKFAAAVYHSLDRKVCNALNVCAIVGDRAESLVPVFLDALDRAGERRSGVKLHMGPGVEALVPAAWAQAEVTVTRAGGPHTEPRAAPIALKDIGEEWEWEATPELTLILVKDVEEAIALFNRHSPKLAASLISEDAEAHDRFYARIDAPFVGDGFTRWVDGQFALARPELGLSNWEQGRLFARSGFLVGDGVYTVRSRMRQTDPDLDRNPATAARP